MRDTGERGGGREDGWKAQVGVRADLKFGENDLEPVDNFVSPGGGLDGGGVWGKTALPAAVDVG